MKNQVVRATVSDLPKLALLANEFYGSSKVLRGFNLDRFIAIWDSFLTNGIGVIFLLMDGDCIQGTLGGMFYPEIYSGERIALEFFWFVHKEFRGGGLKLYRKFEEWAKENECVEVRMAHLVDSMPDKVADFYERVGYSKVETLYAKRLK